MLSLPDALPISSAYLGQPVRNAPMRRNAWRPQNSFDSSSRTEPDRAPVTGYEMHMGETRGPGTARAFAVLEDGKSDGAASADGKVIGSYLHGLFASARLRDALLARIDVAGDGSDYAADVDAALDELEGERGEERRVGKGGGKAGQ